METPQVITGTDQQLTVILQVGTMTKPIPLSSTVKFMLVSQNKEVKFTGVLESDSSHPGADWSQGKMILVFPSSSTIGIDIQGLADVELQVDTDGVDGKLGTFFPVNIVKGNIG